MRVDRIRLVVLMLAFPLFLGSGACSTIASDLSKETSLPLVPADADFYSASFRMESQLQRLLQSKLVSELQKVEFVQGVIDEIKKDWTLENAEMAQAKAILKTPLAQEVLKAVAELASEEIFAFGDSRCSQFLIGLTQLQREMSSISVSEGNEGLLDWVDSLTKEDMNQIPVPTMVMGFKFKDEDRILTILDQIQAIVSLGLNSVPATAIVAEKLERVEDSRGTRLVLNLSSDMIPWEQLASVNEELGDVVDHLEEILEGRKISLTFGTLDKYLLIAISENKKQIASLGKVGSLLENAHLKPLIQDSKQEIIGIAYVSDRISDAQFQSQWKGYFSNLYAQFQPLIALAMGNGLDADMELPEFLDSLEEDLEWLDDEMEQLVPEFKGSLGYSFATAKGYEGYLYSRTESVLLDGSKPLDILKHVNESPLAMLAMRAKYNPKWLALSRKVVRKVKTYLDGFVASGMVSDRDQTEWEIVMKKGWPLLKSGADLFEQKFQPATQDGQHAWTLSMGGLQSKQWAKDMPPAKELLPIPELAFVAGLTDKDKFVEGCAEAFGIFDNLVELLRELNPDAAPAGYSIPRPERGFEAGTELYRYLIPDDCPVPKEMAPQVAFDEHLMIASYSSVQSKALLKRSSLSVGRELIRSDKELAAASYFDFGGLMNKLTPWVRYGLEISQGDLNEFVVPPQNGLPGLKGKDVVDLWNAMSRMGRFSSATEARSGSPTKTHWSYEE